MLTCASPHASGAVQQTDQKTHQWTVYVRSANNEDISHIVPKVQQQPTHPPACGSAPVSTLPARQQDLELKTATTAWCERCGWSSEPASPPAAAAAHLQHVPVRPPPHTHTVVQVVFKLHPSFAQPVRPVEGPSFELTETGWGEFDIGVEVRGAALTGPDA